MRLHTKTLLLAACATGLLFAAGGCWINPYSGDPPKPDACGELSDGGALDCQNGEGARCKLELNKCTYYRLGRYRVIFDLGYGSVYERPNAVPDYGKHSPARRETENVTDTSPAFPRFKVPESVSDLFGAVRLKVSIFDTKTRKWSHLESSAYRALVSPGATYENTVWGRARKQGGNIYVWHVLPWKEVEAYSDLYSHEGRFYKSEFRGRMDHWAPGRPIHWQSGEKEAHDELAKHVSLGLPLVDGWEAYDLNFIFGEAFHWCRESEHDCGRIKSFPEHLRLSFTEVEYDTTGAEDGFLEFKIRKR